MEFVVDDGGRALAGFQGETGDCGCRALAIATGLPYREVYDALNALGRTERTGRRKRGKSNARTGIYASAVKRFLEPLGWLWTPTMSIGSGCKVHLRKEELPLGRLVVSVSRHFVAVLDGVIHDTHNPDRNGRRCVYGYWRAP